MRTKLNSATLAVAGLALANVVSAHPGHSPTDVRAELSQPFAGPDHLLAFGLLASALLIALRIVLRSRAGWKQEARARAADGMARRIDS